ncbi:hypothetical protein [Priestia flexa]|uniref:hypothetical protein n=1 Tax=Priestia flexa TaxID=86664 RepID=UPI00047331F5|nr:hypothetical protein [Priestia flexa]
MDVIKICERIAKDNDITGLTIEETAACEYAMYWDKDNKVIGVNVEVLKLEALECKMPLRDYVIILFCHELGHHTDNELENIDRQINIREQFIANNIGDYLETSKEMKELKMMAERRAWEIGKEFVPSYLLIQYKKQTILSLELAEDIFSGEIEVECLRRSIKQTENK